MSPTVTDPRRERSLTTAPRKLRANGRFRLRRLPQPFARRLALRLAASRRVAFWLLAFVFAAAMLGATLPARCMSSSKPGGISPRPW